MKPTQWWRLTQNRLDLTNLCPRLLLHLACRCVVSTDNSCQSSQSILSSMIIHDETVQEIDEALSHLADGIRHAADFRKQHLLDLVDQMLDAKLGMNQ